MSPRSLYTLPAALLLITAGIIDNSFLAACAAMGFWIAPFVVRQIPQLRDDLHWLNHVEVLSGFSGICILVGGVFANKPILCRYGAVLIGVGLCITVIRIEILRRPKSI